MLTVNMEKGNNKSLFDCRPLFYVRVISHERILLTQNKYVLPGNATCVDHRQTDGTMRKRHITQTVTRQQKHNLSNTTSNPFVSKMIANLERTLRTVFQNTGTKSLTQKKQQQLMKQQQYRIATLDRTTVNAEMVGLSI